MDEKRIRRETDFTKCILCQLSSKSVVVTKSGINSYCSLLQTISERARFDEAEFIPISQRLEDLDPHQLEEHRSFWHRKCYSDATNKTNIERSKDRYIAQGDTPDLLKQQSSLQPEAGIRVTRSSTPLFNKELCFFCQKLTPEKLHTCRSENIGKQISTIVKKCGNIFWQVNYAEIPNQ